MKKPKLYRVAVFSSDGSSLTYRFATIEEAYAFKYGVDVSKDIVANVRAKVLASSGKRYTL